MQIKRQITSTECSGWHYVITDKIGKKYTENSRGQIIKVNPVLFYPSTK